MRKKIIVAIIIILGIVTTAVGVFFLEYKTVNPPGVPTDFTAITISSSRIDLAWRKAENAETIYIERNTLSSWTRGKGILIYNDTGLSFHDTGLSQNSHYYYQAWSWNQTHHVFSNTFIAVDNTTLTNQPPLFGTPTPVNSSANTSFSFTWNIQITDPDGDPFSWVIQCSNGQETSGTEALNGTKSLVLSGLMNLTSYTVWVNATDSAGSGVYTRKWYTFTTKTNQGNTPPVFGAPSPTNGSTGNLLSVTWGIPITDQQGDTFLWTIQCSNGQKSNGTGALNGTKSLSLSGLTYLTSYTVWVNATDSEGSGVYTRKWYTFTTKANLINAPPVFGAPSPTNGSTGNLLSVTWGIPINDPQSDSFNWWIQCSNGQKSNGTGASNGTKSLVLSGLTNLTTYKVWVNATDSTGSGVYTRKWYTFTTKANQPPLFGIPSPANRSTVNLLNRTWSISITDHEGDTFLWTIQCSNGQKSNGTGASNGTKSLALSGLRNATTYKVWVNATDSAGSGVYTRKWYTFTTNINQINTPPVFGAPSPTNRSTGNLLSVTWRIPINDPQSDSFNWWIQCSNGQKSNGTGALNGTKSLLLSGLTYLTNYTVWVNATDPQGSGTYTRKWYTFTTKANQPPVFGAPSPTNGSTATPLNVTWSIPIRDLEGNIFSWTIQCSNGQKSNGTGASNGTKSLLLSSLPYFTSYKVWVNATDPTGSGMYTRQWYTFTTQSQNTPPNKPSTPSGQTNGTVGQEYSYTTKTVDPNGDKMYYLWNWGDGTTSGWLGPYASNTTITATHSWSTKKLYTITVKAKDTNSLESSWSDSVKVTIHPAFEVMSGFMSVDAKIVQVEKVNTMYSFVGTPVKNVSVIGFGTFVTDTNAGLPLRFYMITFTNVSQIIGTAYKKVDVSNAYQHFSLIVMPSHKCVLTLP